MAYRADMERLTERILFFVRKAYGANLVSPMLLGSVAPGVSRPHSEQGPSVGGGRLSFRADEGNCRFRRENWEEFPNGSGESSKTGIHASLSTVLETKEEVPSGNAFFLDMIDWGEVPFGRQAQEITELDDGHAQAGIDPPQCHGARTIRAEQKGLFPAAVRKEIPGLTSYPNGGGRKGDAPFMEASTSSLPKNI